jgi:serine protease Do
VISQLKDHGTIVRGWLGVQIQGITPEIADSLRRTLPNDAQLAAVAPPSTRNQPGAAQTTTLSDFGLTLGRTQDNLGVSVTNVDPNGQAASRGLQSGDVIVAVGDAMVSSPRDVEQKIAEAKAAGQKAVLLRVKSGDRTGFVALSFAT